MTKQEAIEILRDTPIDIRSTREDDIHTLYATAQGMAIEALKETDMGLNNGDHLHPFGEPFGWTEEEIQRHGLRELLKAVDNKNDELSCSEEPNRSDTIYRQDAIDAIIRESTADGAYGYVDTKSSVDLIRKLPSAQPDGYVKIPETGIEDISDGFHTFRQLYYQRMILFATIVKQNRDKAWKSLRHEDGEFCFGGGWFIVGIDTPEGSYTYHYEATFYSLFDCEELERARHWDGHTEKDVTRLLTLTSVQPEQLTDKEQRIFLAAMGRERKVCKQVDEEWRDCREPYEDSLVSVCNEIERKVKGALWDGR